MPFATPGDPEAPVRIVLDTNVVLSALLWRGTPYHHLFQAIREAEPIELFTSEVLLEELREILLRPSPAKRLSLIRLSAGQVLAKYIETVDLVAPIATPRVVRDDIDDDHVIAGPLPLRPTSLFPATVTSSRSASITVSGLSPRPRPFRRFRPASTTTPAENHQAAGGIGPPGLSKKRRYASGNQSPST